MKNKSAIMRKAVKVRANLEKQREILKGRIHDINDQLHLVEMLQVREVGGCHLCGNAHYPHCEELSYGKKE